MPAPKPPAPVPGHIPQSPFLWECLWNGVVRTPASAPGIKVMKPPRLWGLVPGEAGEQVCGGMAWYGMEAWHLREQWLRAHGTDALSGDGCPAKGQML